MQMKKTLLFIFFMSALAAAFFSEQIKKPDYIIDDRRIFMEAQIAFDNQNYGQALKLVEQAKNARRQKVNWEVYTLENSLKPSEVRRAGDFIPDIKPVLEERQDYDALEIIAAYEKWYTPDAFDNSAKKLILFIKNRKEFPEAEYLCGKLYQIEGEYDFAELFFKKAFDFSSLLDVPEEKYDILYSLADISLIKKDFKKYEEYLVLIVSQDAAFKDKNLIRAMKATIQSARADCMEKFFLMYRTDNFQILNAYFLLSEYYQEKNEKDRALTVSALGALTGFSRVYDVVSKRNPEFEYAGLASLLIEACKYSDITEWGVANNVWKGFNDFAENAFKSECPLFAIKLYSVLKEHSPEEYWRREAAVRLHFICAEG